MFRYKKYGADAGELIENRQIREVEKSLTQAEGIDSQSPQTLAEFIDLHTHPILRRLFAKLGEFHAPKCRVALLGEFDNPLFGLPQSAHVGRQRGRGHFQESVHPARARADPESMSERFAHLDARGQAVRSPELGDDRENRGIRDLLRASHRDEVTVNYGNSKAIPCLLPWNIACGHHFLTNMRLISGTYRYQSSRRNFRGTTVEHARLAGIGSGRADQLYSRC
jgi:hypothetical protein